MKKILSLLVALAAPAVFAAKLNVVTTTSDLASITQEIGKDKINVVSLGKGYQDPHFIEPKPSFLLLLRNADLIEVIGLELEIGYLPPLLDQSRNPKIHVGTPGYLDLSQHVEILDRPTGAVNRSMGDVHAAGNPHYWLDPANAVRMAADIAARLSQLDPADAPVFNANLQQFKVKLNDANKRWMTQLAPFRGAKIVTYHNSWPNFVRRFGLNVVGYVEPKPGVPPSPSHTFELMKLMKDQGVKAILVEPYFDRKTPDSLGQQTGAKVLVMYPSVGGTAQLTDYVALFDHNIAQLVQALK